MLHPEEAEITRVNLFPFLSLWYLSVKLHRQAELVNISTLITVIFQLFFIISSQNQCSHEV